jgi:hypothetical protein
MTGNPADPDWSTPLLENRQNAILGDISARNSSFFDEEMEKLEKWAEDLKSGLELEIKDLDAEIKLVKAEAKRMPVLEEKVAAQRRIKDMERIRNEKRHRLYAAQDEVEARKDDLIGDIEKRLAQTVEVKELFRVEWDLV